MKPIRLSIFFPAYNEEKNIEQTIIKTLDILKTTHEIKDFEILVINDGSNDNTRFIVEKISKIDNRIKIINHIKNEGYGAALKTGIKSCKYEYIFFSDSDLQFDIKEIRNMITHTDYYDVIIGYRLNRKDNILRKINATGWNILNRILFKLKIRDINCAFKLFKKDVFNNINIYSNGAMVNAEILIKLQKSGKLFKEIPVNHFPRVQGKQTGANILVIIKSFKEIIRLYKSKL